MATQLPVTINELPPAEVLSGDEVLEAIQNGVSVKVRAADLTATGLSAYEVAVADGYTGTRIQWVASLKGDKGEKGDKGSTGATGIQGTQGIQGPKGDTGAKGDKGNQGDVGSQGVQGVQGVQGLKGDKGDRGDQGLQGIQGVQGWNAYLTAVNVGGFVGTLAQWLASLKGETGAQGTQGIQGIQGFKGDTGTQGLQGLQGLKGDKGDTGNTGAKGDIGLGLKLLGSLPNEAALPAVEESAEGECFLIGTHFWAFNGVAWADLGSLEGPAGESAYDMALDAGFVGTEADYLDSLHGEDGIGLRILGSFPSTGNLPMVNNQNGDAYIVQFVMYVWDGNSWEPVGQVGPTGKSAYQAAIDQGLIPGSMSLTDYLNSLKGKSAYQLATDSGFTGNMAEWLESIKGEKGDTGDQGPQGIQGLQGVPAAAIKVLGQFATVGELPAAGNVAGDAYFVGLNLYVWTGSWLNVGNIQGQQGLQGVKGDKGDTGNTGATGATGKSAYQFALDNGFVGSESAWLAAMQGDDGVSAYQVALDNGFVGTQTAWLISLRGDQGLQGIQGIQGIQGVKGDTGSAGAIGAAFVPRGTKVDYAALLGTVAPAAGHTYTLLDTGHAWSWDGAQWIDMGLARGPQGERGLTGDTGATGATGAKGDTGNAGSQGIQGIQGLQGVKGDTGDTGAALKLLGSKVNVGALPASGNATGDGWMVDDHLWIWNGTAWVDAGSQKGATGQSAYEAAVAAGFVGNTAAWIASLKGEQGDVGLTGPQGEQGIQGIQGIQGDDGPQGITGPGLNVLGKKATVGELPGTGTIGEGWVVGLNFWVWTGAAFEDMGPFQGPKGDRGIQGVQGTQGIQGIQGVKGDIGTRGSVWIALARAPNPVDGIPGDYFINTVDNTYYYKSGATTWLLLGNLGAGNVFDAPSDGVKRVRLNGAWTELVIPVGEAPTDGGLYVRKDGAWQVITLAPSDGKYYVRKDGAWVEMPTPVNLDRYTLKTGATTASLDLAVQQVFTVDASVARTLTFANTPGTATRALTVVVVVRGNAGAVTWPAGITWSGNTTPVLAATFTTIVLLWDGIGWTGSVGATA